MPRSLRNSYGLKSEGRRVNVDFPTWMIQALDKESRRLGVTRQSIIKVWIAERLQTVETMTENSSR
jgi:hypothetical protein